MATEPVAVHSATLAGDHKRRHRHRRAEFLHHSRLELPGVLQGLA
jgi:hypothetical protein